MSYLVGALLLGFIAFAIVRVLGFGTWIGIVLLFGIVVSGFFYCQTISVKHGDHGLAKRSAYDKRPRILKSKNRSVFLKLKK